MKFLTKFLLMFALVLTMNLNVQAQESAPTLAIEEIIVTARKKEVIHSRCSCYCDCYY